MRVRTTCRASVSYTHLDVYKRQIYYDSAIPHAMYAVDSDCHFIAVVIK